MPDAIETVYEVLSIAGILFFCILAWPLVFVLFILARSEKIWDSEGDLVIGYKGLIGRVILLLAGFAGLIYWISFIVSLWGIAA